MHNVVSMRFAVFVFLIFSNFVYLKYRIDDRTTHALLPLFPSLSAAQIQSGSMRPCVKNTSDELILSHHISMIVFC